MTVAADGVAILTDPARQLINADVVGCAEPPDWTEFRSGILSPVYIDNRKIWGRPGWRSILRTLLVERMRTVDCYYESVIASVEKGGDMYGALIADRLKRPFASVRKKKKKHATKRLIEGADVDRQSVIIFEDHITTSGSVLDAVTAVRDAGGFVAHIFAITSYDFPDAYAEIKKANVSLTTLVSFQSLLAEMERSGRFDAHIDRVKEWHADPAAWTEAHR